MSYQLALDKIKQAAMDNATDLDLSHLNLTAIPREIQLVKNLTILYLFGNQITKIENLETLPLQHLYLANNQITKIENLDNLPLLSLNLSGNLISKIEHLDNLPLEWLYLDCNQISKIENLETLPLRELTLIGNDIRLIENLKNLPLRKIILSCNQITEVQPLLHQTNSNLEIFFKRWFPKNRCAIDIQHNPIKDCPKKILWKGRAAIAAYFFQEGA